VKKIRTPFIADLCKAIDGAQDWKELFEILLPGAVKDNKVFLTRCKQRDIKTAVDDAVSKEVTQGHYRELVEEIVREMKERGVK
jgi:hypothetical protein